MSKTYIVKAEDETQLIVEIGVNSTGAAVIATNPVSYLTPYTEPDVEQIREEAFKNGYDAACKDIDVKSKINAAYQKGLEDAWEAARKIACVPANGGIPTAELNKIFTREKGIFSQYTVNEAIEIIQKYEQEQEEIKVGDEVNSRGGKGIIARISNDGNYFNVMWENGSTGCYRMECFKKTGRHFPEIAEVLKKMQEEES